MSDLITGTGGIVIDSAGMSFFDIFKTLAGEYGNRYEIAEFEPLQPQTDFYIRTLEARLDQMVAPDTTAAVLVLHQDRGDPQFRQRLITTQAQPSTMFVDVYGPIMGGRITNKADSDLIAPDQVVATAQGLASKIYPKNRFMYLFYIKKEEEGLLMRLEFY